MKKSLRALGGNKPIVFTAAQLAAIVESSQDAIVGKDLQGVVTTWNQGAEQIFGYAAAEMIGQSIRILIPPDRQPEEDEFLDRVRRGERVEHFETVRRRKDGKLIDVAVTVSPIRDLLGRVTGVSKIARDITEHKRAEDEIRRLKDELEERVRERTAELRASEAMLRSITDHTDDFVFIKDGAGRFVFANPALCRANGCTPEQMRGRTAAELNPDAAEVERFTAEDRQVMAERRTLTVEESRTIRGTGERQTLLTIKSPRLDAGGKVIGLIGISHDITERKRAEEALHHSEKRFHSVWNKSADGMRLTDKDGVIVAVNEAYCQLTGLRAEELAGQPFTVSYATDDPEKSLRKYRERFAARAIETRLERRMTYRSGKTADLVVSNSFVEAGQPEPLLLGIFHDITDRKRAEQALTESERFIRAALDSLTAHIAVLDTDGTILATNESWRHFALANGQDWRAVSDGANYLAVCGRASGASAETVGEITAGIRDVIAGRRTHFAGEYPCPSPSGQRWFACRVTRFPGSGPVRVVLVYEDITSTRAAQRRFHDLFEFAPDAIVMTNRDGIIKLANRPAETMFGWTREELIGQPVERLMPHGSREGHVSLRERFMQSAMPRTMGEGRTNLQGKRKDGTVFPVDISLAPMETEEGIMVAAAVRDVTEREKTERLANRSQRLESIGTLAGGIAHDLNNALGPIMMAVELLKMQHPDDVEMLDMVESSTQRAADMVRQLLTFAKGAEGHRVSIQFLHLVKEMEKIIKGTFPKNIRLQVSLAKELPTVLGDATQLHQVLLNLCVNARDAMPHGGTLTIEAAPAEVDAAFAGSLRATGAQPGQYLALRVTDTGTGIPPEILDRIFDPFFTTKGPDKGTGLGLSTVMGIVKGHGGFLQVSSQPGHGSTFGIFLPVEQGHGHAEEDTRVRSSFRGRGETILYVDDEATIRDVARTVLGHLNFTPITATDGADALIQVAQNRTALRAIITDLHMPHMDGLTLVRMVRRVLPDIPMVVASGRLEEHLAAEFKALGVHLTLDKPFTQDQMAEALQAALQDPRPVHLKRGGKAAANDNPNPQEQTDGGGARREKYDPGGGRQGGGDGESR